jgi:hypothetical protein
VHGLDTSSLSVLNGGLVLGAAKRDRRRAVERLEPLEQASFALELPFQLEKAAPKLLNRAYSALFFS